MAAALERYRVAVVVTLFLLLATAGVVIYLRRPVAQAIEILETSPSPADSVHLAVYVSGAVVNPGVYYLPEESRVQDALQAAGGPTADADLDRVNLAQRLHDEDHIYFPTLGEEDVPLTSTTGSAAALTDINTASAPELEALPGIGPTLAQAIVEYREGHGPFATIEQITDVQGVGQGIFEDIRSLITVG
jgi:competence protein ComEA